MLVTSVSGVICVPAINRNIQLVLSLYNFVS